MAYVGLQYKILYDIIEKINNCLYSETGARRWCNYVSPSLGFKPVESTHMPPLKLDIQNLIVFYQVATEQSLSSAAEKLCLSQPTITYHIKTLETNVGVKLLDVKKQKIILTRAGLGLFKYASEAYHQMLGAEKFLENLKENNLHVGFSSTFSSTVAAAASAFEDAYPGVKLIVKNATSFEIAEDVSNMQVDLGIVVNMDFKNPKLKSIPLSSRERLVLAASPSSPIFKKKNLEFIDICGYPLITGPETSATRRIILNKLKIRGSKTTTPILMEVNNPEWGKSLVESGKGMGLYHRKSVEKDISEGKLKALPLPGDIYVGADALIRNDAPDHAMTLQFITLVKKAFE
jgi:DNA-binding transcriptional LysR family regulator